MTEMRSKQDERIKDLADFSVDGIFVVEAGNNC